MFSRRFRVNKVNNLCAHMDISIEEMRTEQSRTTLKNINFVLLRMPHSFKVPFTSRISYRVPNLLFSRGEGWGGGGGVALI